MGKKVLVIDDDRSTVRYLSVVLSENGYEPSAAYNGSEGFEKIKEMRPDLVVLDVMMPKKSGFVLFKELKKKEEFRSIPVLMLSGVAGILDEMDAKKDESPEKPYDSLREAMRKTIAEMKQNGIVRPEMFLDKPVDPGTFISRVRDLIGD
ncbi:MAG: response regulator [Planctomycetota bacterium]|jgi:CheY-like chemotaxis protein